MRAAMRRVAETMAEIGWGNRLQDLSEAPGLALIAVAVGGFQEAMQAIARQDAAAEVPF